jgi:hypothetical protein
VGILLAVVAGAAGYEAAHRVADEHQLLDADRPARLEVLGQARQPAAVRRHAQAGVVAQVHRRESELVLEAIAVGAAVGVGGRARGDPPGGFGLAQAVYEHDDPWRGAGERGREAVGVGGDLVAVATDIHRQREGVVAVDEVVSVQAIQRAQRQRRDRTRRERRLVRAGAGAGVGAGVGVARRELGASPGRPAQTGADAPVDGLRDPVVEHARRRGRHAERPERAGGDPRVHVPDQLAACRERLPGDLAYCLYIRLTHEPLLGGYCLEWRIAYGPAPRYVCSAPWSGSPPHSSGATSAIDCENVHR